MQVYDVIAEAQNGAAIANLARTFGLTDEQVEAVMNATLPALVNGIERNTLSRGGLADIVKALGSGHHEQILERPDVHTDPRVHQDGRGIPGHSLGSESRARGVAVQAAKATGVSESIIEMLLPILAQMLMGALSKWLKGGLGDITSRLPGGPPREPQSSDGQAFPMPPLPQNRPFPGSQEPQQPGGMGPGFELPRADMPTGGDPMPPIPGGQSPDGWPRQQGFPDTSGAGNPLPLPQQQPANNPYGDLSDILRRGGNVGGGNLGGSIRDMLGGALGFKNKGVISWLLRLLIMRFGWNILKRVLGRAFAGR
jgi:hypothetical protein